MNFHLYEEPIEHVDKVKLQGTIIDSQLSWADNIDTIVKKMGCGISMVRKCRSYVPTHILGHNWIAYLWLFWSYKTYSEINNKILHLSSLALLPETSGNTILYHKRVTSIQSTLVLHETTRRAKLLNWATCTTLEVCWFRLVGMQQRGTTQLSGYMLPPKSLQCGRVSQILPKEWVKANCRQSYTMTTWRL